MSGRKVTLTSVIALLFVSSLPLTTIKSGNNQMTSQIP